MTTVILCQSILLAVFAQPQSNEGRDITAGYDAAMIAYQAGKWAAAAESFRQIARSNPRAAPFARFGFANARVQQAIADGTASDVGRVHLDEAIGAYRAVLDGSVPEPLRLDDVRHNLELAKRLRCELISRSDGARRSPASDTAADVTRRSSLPEGSRTRDTEPSPTENEASERQTKKDEGDVPKPTAGLPLVDPGPLSLAEAEARLQAALERWKARERDRREHPQTRRPRVPGDY